MTENEFQREEAERAYEYLQVAQMASIGKSLQDYAMTAWRPMTIAPPRNVPLLTSCVEGVCIMVLNDMADWRCSGQPHHPPIAWMPCPQPFVSKKEVM